MIAHRRPARLRRAAAAHPSRGVARRRCSRQQKPSSFVAWDLLALGDEDLRARPQIERRERARGALARRRSRRSTSRRRPAIARVARDWFQRFEGAGLDGVMAKPETLALHARQARDDEDQAPAHRRLRRRRLPLVQGRQGQARRLAAARPLRRRRRAASRRRDRGRSSRRARRARELLEPLRESARENHPWSDWAEWQDGRPKRAAHARRDEPVEPRQGSVVGAAPARARLRGRLRSPAGHAVSPRARTSSAGAPTSRRASAATISSRRRPAFEIAQIFGGDRVSSS